MGTPRRRATDAVNSAKSVDKYVIAVVVLAIVTVLAIVAVVILRPESDNTAVIAAIGATTSSIILTFMVMIQRESHQTMNSKLDELVETRTTLAETRGVIKGTRIPVSPEAANQLLEALPDSPESGDPKSGGVK